MTKGSQVVVDVVLPLAVSQFFTYKVPEEFSAEMEPGKRVIVPFGKQRIFAALIKNVRHSSENLDDYKQIQSVLDEKEIAE